MPKIFNSKSVIASSEDKNANILLIKFFQHRKNFTQACQEIQKAKGRGTQIPSNIRMYVDEGIKRDDIKKRNEIIQNCK